jgi:cell division protein FtsN
MSLATWTVTLAAAGLLIHAMNKKKEITASQSAEPLGEPGDAWSTTDPVSGRVKPMPAMPSDDEEIQPGLGDFARGA